MFVLGIDYGEKNIGLAISDETELVASTLPYLKVKHQQEAADLISEICKDLRIEKVVLGLPTGWENIDSPTTIRVKEFKELLAKKTNLPIAFWDETYSSKRASKINKKNKAKIHSISAAIILQEYLDHQRD